jgi:predicted transcriptional regulator
MYEMRYTNPKLCGYVYRRRNKCGKPSCRCAKDNKYKHTSYQLQYRELVKGKWVRRSEYIPKNQVRSLRAKIKRAKQKDKETKEAVKDFLDQVPSLAERLKNPFDTEAGETISKALTDLWQSLRMKSLLDLDRVFNRFSKSS